MGDTARRYDLCILGAGPAGYAAAVRAHDLGKRVALVEQGRIGGTGIHCGALSSKTLWHLANDYAGACRSDRGFIARDVEVSYAAVMRSVAEAAAERRSLYEQQLAHLGDPSIDVGQVDLFRGRGRFVSPGAVEVRAADGALSLVEADNFLVATGSSPRRLEGIEVDGDRIVTSDQIESLAEFPASMVIVGAGVVGCEYATVFAKFRRTRISIIDRQPRILPFEDEDVADRVASNFERMGVMIHRESTLESLKVVDGAVEYVLKDARGERGPPIRVERALISAGRVPNTSNLGLESVGVSLDKQGGIAVDDTRSTSLPNVYAAGDTTLDVALVNIAELEGRHAVERMFGRSPAPIRYEALSAIMFLSPEVASVGLNEQQARKQKIPYRYGVVSNRLINRYIAMRNTDGFVKLLAGRDDPGRVLGLRVVGPQASSAIQGVAFLIDRRGTLEDIDACVHPHPAITEGVQECARLILGRSMHKPEFFGEDLLRRGEG